MDRITLEWYRDRYNGQKAADHFKANQVIEGISWPKAVLPCTDNAEADRIWREIYDMFEVNAMTHTRVG